MTKEEIIAKYPPEIKELTEEARILLLKLLPGVEEMSDPSANIIGYGYSNKYTDLICTIILSKKGIKIGFYKGTELPDPVAILTGTGKVHKYAEIKTMNDLKNPALKNLIKAGYKAWEIRSKK